MLVEEVIKQIENGNVNWDNVYDIEIDDPENIELLETYSNQKKLLQMALKIAINSLN